MDEYYLKYAKPLEIMDIGTIRKNLVEWRENLKEELEGILFLKSGINSDTSQGKKMNKTL